MKTNKNLSLFFNPFTRIAGWQAFAIGLVVMLATSLVSYFSHVVLDGVVDVHFSGEKMSLAAAFLNPFVSHTIFVLVAWLIALCFTRGFRFIDLLGTLTFARIPMFLVALLGLFVEVPCLQELLANPMTIFNHAGFLAMLIVSALIGVWVVVLFVNALKVSCDLRGGKLAAVVVVSLLVTEILAKLLLQNFLPIC